MSHTSLKKIAKLQKLQLHLFAYQTYWLAQTGLFNKLAIHILDRTFQLINSIQLLYFFVKLQKMIPTEYWKLSMACERATGKHTRQIEYHSLAIRWQQTSPRPSCKSIATNPAKTHWLHRQCTNHPCCHPPISLHFFFYIFNLFYWLRALGRHRMRIRRKSFSDWKFDFAHAAYLLV